MSGVDDSNGLMIRRYLSQVLRVQGTRSRPRPIQVHGSTTLVL